MLPRRAFFAAALCLLALSAGAYAADDERVWIAVTVSDGRGGAGVEYYGQIQNSTFKEIVDGTKEKGFFKLEKVFWLTDKGTPERLVAQPSGYTSVAYFKISNIERIVPLKKNFIEELAKHAEEENKKAEQDKPNQAEKE